MVGVGIVGSGYMAGTYAEAVKTYVKEGRLVAVAGGSRAPAFAAEYSIDCEPMIEELVARPDVNQSSLRPRQTATCGIPSLPPQPENMC